MIDYKLVKKSLRHWNVLPFFLVVNDSIRILNSSFIKFSIKNGIYIVVFDNIILDNPAWFVYKMRKRGIEIIAPGIHRKKYKTGSSLKLNKEIYSKDKPAFLQWTIESIFAYGVVRQYFYPEVKKWEELGIKKYMIIDNNLCGETYDGFINVLKRNED